MMYFTFLAQLVKDIFALLGQATYSGPSSTALNISGNSHWPNRNIYIPSFSLSEVGSSLGAPIPVLCYWHLEFVFLQPKLYEFVHHLHVQQYTLLGIFQEGGPIILLICRWSPADTCKCPPGSIKVVVWASKWLPDVSKWLSTKGFLCLWLG